MFNKGFKIAAYFFGRMTGLFATTQNIVVGTKVEFMNVQRAGVLFLGENWEMKGGGLG